MKIVYVDRDSAVSKLHKNARMSSTGGVLPEGKMVYIFLCPHCGKEEWFTNDSEICTALSNGEYFDYHTNREADDCCAEPFRVMFSSPLSKLAERFK